MPHTIKLLSRHQLSGRTLKSIKFSLQVLSTAQVAVPGVSDGTKNPNKADRAGKLFEQGWKSEVVCEVTDIAKKATEEISSTQGRLYMVLWTGDVNILRSPIEPPMPLICAALTRELGNVGDKKTKKEKPTPEVMALRTSFINAVAVIRGHLLSEVKNPNLFVTVYDPTNAVSVEKCAAVRSELGQMATIVERTIRLGEVGLGDLLIVPTCELIAFAVSGASSVVEDALRRALYRPSSESAGGKDGFKLQRHGFYLPSNSEPPNTAGKPSNTTLH